MKIACLAAFASLRGALLFAVLASFAGAQNQTWIRQLGTAVIDWSRAAAPDGAGGVYISGISRGPITGSSEVWLAHYDGAGNQIWIRRIGAPGDDHVYAAAPDGAGGVYVGGQTESSLGGPNTAGFVEAWLAHYDNAGNQTWIRQFGTPGGEGTKLFAAAPDG